MNNGELLNDSFTASSYNVNNEPWSARLNRVISAGGWCAANNITGEYLLIDLGKKKRVTGISTQGKHGKDAKWVTEYTVSSAIELNNLQHYMVDGNIKVSASLTYLSKNEHLELNWSAQAFNAAFSCNFRSSEIVTRSDNSVGNNSNNSNNNNKRGYDTLIILV